MLLELRDEVPGPDSDPCGAPAVGTGGGRYLGEGADLSPASDDIAFRNRNGVAGRLETLMQAHAGLPRDLGEYVDLSMWLQAEGLRVAIEACRRRKWACSGVMFWQWNDDWPSITWSVTDVDNLPKASYFAVKRAYAPVVITAHARYDRMHLAVVNDTDRDLVDRLHWELMDFDGTVVDSVTAQVDVGPDSVTRLTPLARPEERVRPSRVLHAWLESGRAPDVRMFFAEYRDLQREKAALEIDWQQDGDDLVATLTADRPALHVSLLHTDPEVTADDNWVDVFPGRPRTIRLSGSSALDPDDVEVRWL